MANRLEPGKRPMSAMSPTLVYDRSGRLLMALGSAGGPRIIMHVLKTLIGVIDWKKPVAEAIALPNIVARGPNFNADADKFAPGVVDGLYARGVDVRGASGEESGLHGFLVTPNGYVGGADPRRDGNSVTEPVQ